MSGPLMTSGLQPTPAVKAPVPVVKPAAGSTAAPAAPTLKAPAVAPKATMMGRDLERAWKVKLAAENAGAVVGLKTVQKGAHIVTPPARPRRCRCAPTRHCAARALNALRFWSGPSGFVRQLG